MTSDCYAILGVSRAAEDVVIRAAYLALMRRYHPDRDPSPGAAARAQEVTYAYQAIGDPISRADYDARRAELHYPILGVMEADERPVQPKPRMRAPVLGGIAASVLALLGVAAVLPLMEREQTRPRPEQAGATSESKDSPVIAGPSPLIPPRTIEPLPMPDVPMAIAPPATDEPEPLVEIAPPAPQRAATRAAAAEAEPEAEGVRLAAIERQSTLFYNQSVAHADAGRKLRLQQARSRFETARSGCRSPSCAADAHLGHMRDVARIMESRGASTL